MFNKSELSNFTTNELMVLQDETITNIVEVKERLANGETQTDPNTGLELDDYLWGLHFTFINILDVLAERLRRFGPNA